MLPASAVHSPEASYPKLPRRVRTTNPELPRLPAQLGGQLHVELLAWPQARGTAEVAKALAVRSCFSGSEDDLGCQLYLERLARTNAWSSLGVRDGVLDPTEAAWGIAAKQAVNTVDNSRDVPTAFVEAAKDASQVFAVEDVEHLGAELDLKPFRDGHVLDHGHVYA